MSHIVIIIRKIHAIFDWPLHKLFKKDHSMAIWISLFEGFFRIINFYSPFLHQRNSLFELVVANSSIIIRINSVETNPILIVLPKIVQQIFELSFGDIIITVFILGWWYLSCGLVCSHDDWFQVKHWRNLNDVPESFINLR